jgi:hypothetical protein
MDLAGVANGVAAVETKISQLQKLIDQRSPHSITTTQTPQNELVRFEEDVSQYRYGFSALTSGAPDRSFMR